jgi:hypothetical protein
MGFYMNWLSIRFIMIIAMVLFMRIWLAFWKPFIFAGVSGFFLEVGRGKNKSIISSLLYRNRLSGWSTYLPMELFIGAFLVGDESEHVGKKRFSLFIPPTFSLHDRFYLTNPSPGSINLKLPCQSRFHCLKVF